MITFVATIMLLVLLVPAQAADNAAQLAGLFMQSCVAFAGDRDGLRAWATRNHLPALPPPGQSAFLRGQPGVAYDATNNVGKFVVLSGDNGGCSAIAEHAEPQQLITRFEQDLRDSGLPVLVIEEHDDPDDRALHHRSYRIGRWIFVVSTATGGGEGPAMVTARVGS
jgi:hypothetical protein